MRSLYLLLATAGSRPYFLGSAAALEPQDWIFPSYREHAAAFLRGLPLKAFMCGLLGNAGDAVKGRQMPCHYVFAKGHYLSISSPVGTQIPHAMGIAWGMKLRKEKAAVLVYFGDGATSTPDFHVAMNFAGVYRAPCVFFCNNNQWAISLPVSHQTATATLAEKAAAYGFEGVRVDGMDALAVFGAVRRALRAVQAGGVLDAKTKELIAIAASLAASATASETSMPTLVAIILPPAPC